MMCGRDFSGDSTSTTTLTGKTSIDPQPFLDLELQPGKIDVKQHEPCSRIIPL
jgi:hypothetical protein